LRQQNRGQVSPKGELWAIRGKKYEYFERPHLGETRNCWGIASETEIDPGGKDKGPNPAKLKMGEETHEYYVKNPRAKRSDRFQLRSRTLSHDWGGGGPRISAKNLGH